MRLPAGLEIIINSGHSPTVIRKRLRRALLKAGVKNPEVEESISIPQELLNEVAGLTEFRSRADLAAGIGGESFHKSVLPFSKARY